MLGAKVEAEFVDDFDAVIAEPVVPAVGTDFALNALAHFIRHGRLGQLPGPSAHRATGPVAVETVASGPAGRADWLRRLRNGLAELHQHAAHFIARHLVAALIGHFPAFLQYLDGLVALLQGHM